MCRNLLRNLVSQLFSQGMSSRTFAKQVYWTSIVACNRVSSCCFHSSKYFQHFTTFLNFFRFYQFPSSLVPSHRPCWLASLAWSLSFTFKMADAERRPTSFPVPSARQSPRQMGQMCCLVWFSGVLGKDSSATVDAALKRSRKNPSQNPTKSHQTAQLPLGKWTLFIWLHFGAFWGHKIETVGFMRHFQRSLKIRR